MDFGEYYKSILLTCNNFSAMYRRVENFFTSKILGIKKYFLQTLCSLQPPSLTEGKAKG
jgi:hypothetical protein